MAAGLGLAALAASTTPASATTYLKLLSSSMDTRFQAYIQGDGAVYSNGMTFTVKDSDALGHTTGSAYDIFGFCVDIYHSITIGGLNLVYSSNQDPAIVDPLPTDFGGHAVSPVQLSKLTNLIDTGYLMHQQEVATNTFSFDTQMRLAAIQAAIWHTEVPTIDIHVTKGGLTTSQFATYQTYFNDYSSGNYTSLADANDRFYVITNASHQSFGIGWPISSAPEPGTWALMLGGFFGAGAVLRRRRAALAA
ncbi:MAG TPA: PEP-CTERM sorting domain-containing protein [Phenylobacterium sp.]|nr:PEP-CTERM sorting domain-containing protein [Phenylobacterium sp.]